jgi:hypothetical protein
LQGIANRISFARFSLSKAKIDNVRIYIQGQNLFTITNYGGLDPAMGTRDGTNALKSFPMWITGITLRRECY